MRVGDLLEFIEREQLTDQSSVSVLVDVGGRLTAITSIELEDTEDWGFVWDGEPDEDRDRATLAALNDPKAMVLKA